MNGVPFFQFSEYAKKILFENCDINDICIINFIFFELCHIINGNIHIMYQGWKFVISKNRKAITKYSIDLASFLNFIFGLNNKIMQ